MARPTEPGVFGDGPRAGMALEERSGGAAPAPALDTLRASVIVCTHNPGPVIEQTLESLIAQDFPPAAFDIVVVDNASPGGLPPVLRMMAERHPGRIRIVREPVLGLSRARNRGIAASRGGVVAFTDDDARLDGRWLRTLVEACERPGVGCAGGGIQASLDHPLPAWLSPAFLGYLSVWDKGPDEIELTYNEYPRGVNMAFPRQSFEAVGLFSTVLGRKGRSLLSYEEIELCYRLERLGRRILYVPDALVHHVIHEDRLALSWFQRRFYWQGKSEAYFDLVHHGHRHAGARAAALARAALAARARGLRSPVAALDLRRATWMAIGYAMGALQGWATRVASRGRPDPYAGRSAPAA